MKPLIKCVTKRICILWTEAQVTTDKLQVKSERRTKYLAVDANKQCQQSLVESESSIGRMRTVSYQPVNFGPDFKSEFWRVMIDSKEDVIHTHHCLPPRI